MKKDIDETYVHIFIIALVVALAFFWSKETEDKTFNNISKPSKVIPQSIEMQPPATLKEIKQYSQEHGLKDNRFVRRERDEVSYDFVSPRLNESVWIEWKDVDTNTNQVLFFTSPSCGPCMKMKNTVWTNDQVKERIAEYLDSPLIIDTSIKQNDDKFTQYKIKYLPTIIMIDAEGYEVKRNVGFMDVDELLNFLN